MCKLTYLTPEYSRVAKRQITDLRDVTPYSLVKVLQISEEPSTSSVLKRVLCKPVVSKLITTKD
jgi:hypothetical protein